MKRMHPRFVLRNFKIDPWTYLLLPLIGLWVIPFLALSDVSLTFAGKWIRRAFQTHGPHEIAVAIVGGIPLILVGLWSGLAALYLAIRTLSTVTLVVAALLEERTDEETARERPAHPAVEGPAGPERLT